MHKLAHVMWGVASIAAVLFAVSLIPGINANLHDKPLTEGLKNIWFCWRVATISATVLSAIIAFIAPFVGNDKIAPRRYPSSRYSDGRTY